MAFLEQASKVPANILDTIRKQKLVSRYLILTICLLISALQLNLFLLPSKIVSGGTGGVSIITNYLFGWDPSLVVLVISSTLLILSTICLGVEKTSGTVLATFLYPLFIKLTAPIVHYVSIDTNDLILLSIFIGVIGGVTSGLMFKTGFSSGGLNIISQLLYKYFQISISKSNLVINTIVVLVGGMYFGWTQVMYAIIIIYINSLMIDKVLLGVSKNKAFYIITGKDEEVKDYVINHLGHGVTLFNVKGGFLEKRRQVLMTVVPTKEYFQLTEGIRLIDKDAFFVAMDAYQVFGGSIKKEKKAFE